MPDSAFAPSVRKAIGPVARRFDRAAPRYDQAASVQEEIAAHLVARAAATAQTPLRILDIGSGTGFAALLAARRWPRARIAALDAAPAMLEKARGKMPALDIIAGDAVGMDFPPRFDLILSSMALHWLPNPRAALLRWRGWLKPHGQLHVALPVAGSFHAWRALCEAGGIADGLWPLPRAAFAVGLASAAECRTITVAYPSARDFLLRLKATGAATPRMGHRPLSAARMRRLLATAPQPFAVNYDVLYLTVTASFTA